MDKKNNWECELCGNKTVVYFCKCDACRNVIYDNTPDSPERDGRWLCKECLKDE